MLNIFIDTGSSVFLDLGGALSALGLIFAGYQLIDAKGKLILKIRSSWQRNLFIIFCSIGIFVSLFYAIIMQTSIISSFPGVLHDQILYEIVSYVCFIISILLLILFSKHEHIFNSKTSERFYVNISSYVFAKKDDYSGAVIDLFLANFDSICNVLKNTKQGEKVNDYALAIVDMVLTDDYIVDILITKKQDLLHRILFMIEKNGMRESHFSCGISKIIHDMFYNSQSFLYKQKSYGYNNILLYCDFCDVLFKSSYFLNNFSIFEYVSSDYVLIKSVGLSFVDVIERSLEYSIEYYLVSGLTNPNEINKGFSILSSIFENTCYEISLKERLDYIGKDNELSIRNNLKDKWSILSSISCFVNHDYLFIAKHGYKNENKINEAVQEKEKKASSGSFHSNDTINDGFAELIYKAFESLSILKIETYDVTFALLEGMIYNEDLKYGYRDLFSKMIWNRISGNIIKKTYPAVLKVYLQFIGFCLVSDHNNKGWIGEQTERMRRLLYVDLKPLIDSDVKMVNDRKIKDALLPPCMDYKKDEGFIYISEFGNGPRSVIEKPEDGALSALDENDEIYNHFNI